MKYKDPLIVGITGGMGSGQSTAAAYFEERGCKVINADQEAKTVIRKNRGLQSELKKAFGKEIFGSNRKLDTKLLAQLAFKDELQTRKLNQIVHPRMVESLIDKMEKARFSGKYPIIAIDAALIFEISIERNFDYVIVVTAQKRKRQQRVIARDKMSRTEFLERVDKQLPLEDKVKWADFVIDNNGTEEELKAGCEKVYQTLMEGQVAVPAKMRTGRNNKRRRRKPEDVKKEKPAKERSN